MKRVAVAVVAAVMAMSLSAQTRATKTRTTHAELAGARKALFEDSQLEVARTLTEAALRQNAASVEALFLQMETAALQADTATEVEAALRLCELRGPARHDRRVMIAAARLLDLAGNTEVFRGAIPRIQALLTNSHTAATKSVETRAEQPHPQANYLREALIAAAADGAPGIAMQQVAREAGLLTEWRVAGPFGRYPNLDFDRPWAPEHDGLAEAASNGHAVERVRFDDGAFRLPEYFSLRGVLYASAEATTSGVTQWLLHAESPGTLEVFVDGARMLRKDDRFRITPENAWRALRLRPGTHRVLVKFLPSALPFRLAMLPSGPGRRSKPALVKYAPEAAYLDAAQKYWQGDYQGAIAALDGARSAAAYFLLFRAWEHVAEDAPEAAVMLNAAVKASPEALAAEYELALRAYAAERTDDALSRLEPVLAARPNFAPAERLMADIAIRLHWPVEAMKALEVRIRVHPDCETLRQAQKFLAAHARYERAQELDKELETCAPDSLAYARGLSESGRHELAAAAAQKIAIAHPLDRAARELLVRELALAGQTKEAAEAARELAALAPNSARYQFMAQAAASNPDELLDDRVNPPNQNQVGWGTPDFYSPYRRDGVQMVRQTAERRFAGGPAVMLVNDRVVRLAENGDVALYVHKVTRVLDRDGIERYGEVELLPGAEVLELRTIKADGTVVEPEWNQRKATISMPALAPGDAIEQEYVQNYRDGGGLATHREAFRHRFGSLEAPILYSRFVAITPAGDENARVEVSGDVPPARTQTRGAVPTSANSRQTWSTLTQVWEQNDIAQSIEEVASARGDILPTVRLEPVFRDGWREVRDRYRNLLIDVARAGPRVEEMAAQVRALPPQARARTIYRMVASTIRGSESALDNLNRAEDTLASHTGSRTAALLAIARAAGLDADLVLARKAGTVIGGSHVCQTRADVGHPQIHADCPLLTAYTQPLVRFRIGDGHGRVSETVVDAEADGLAFGALPPGVERADALLVTFPDLAERQVAHVAPPIIALPASAVSDQSEATAEISLDRDGNLSAQIRIALGAWRAAQMRSILSGLEPAQRPQFFQQLAARIFPGAEDVSGDTNNERDPEQTLVIVLHCRAPHFTNLAQTAADIDQLVPALGLKKMYVSGGVRKFPLFIDTPLIETSSFRLHLPDGVSALRPADAVEIRNEFGSYSLKFRQISPEELEITRSFDIPVQVIPPERFAQFARFAGKIDDAERQRITLQE